jgi:hypothetical protein
MAFAGAALRQKKSAIPAAVATVLIGISSCASTARLSPRSTSSGPRCAFAPGATTIWFSPESETRISANPVSVPTLNMELVSTPTPLRILVAMEFKRSLPTQPFIRT